MEESGKDIELASILADDAARCEVNCFELDL